MGGLVDAVFGGGNDAPDPYAVANAQGQANTEAARITAMMNRADQITPWGSQLWSQTPAQAGTDQWTSTITLDPRAQSLLNQQFETSLGLGGATQSALENVQKTFAGDPVDSNEAYRKQVEDALYGRYTSRLDPQWGQATSDLESKLAAQGITQGSAAYDREVGNLSRAKTDAYQAAMDQAVGGGESAIQGQFNRDMAGRMQVLNELNALRSGSQVSQPQFGSTQSGASVAASPVAQSIYNSYNAGQAQNQALMGGLTSLGSAAMMAPTGTFAGLASFFSDRRLKSNIKRVGTHRLGIGIYEYDIFNERQRGVMADEVENVLPAAVTTDSSGYKMVNYGML